MRARHAPYSKPTKSPPVRIAVVGLKWVVVRDHGMAEKKADGVDKRVGRVSGAKAFSFIRTRASEIILTFTQISNRVSRNCTAGDSSTRSFGNTVNLQWTTYRKSRNK